MSSSPLSKSQSSNTSSQPQPPPLPTTPPPPPLLIKQEQDDQNSTLESTLIPTLKAIYSQQNVLPGGTHITSESLKDIIFHAIRYPSQTTFGLMIGKFDQNRLNIIEIVPISHTTNVSPMLFESALEITNMRLAKTSSLNTFKEEMSTFGLYNSSNTMNNINNHDTMQQDDQMMSMGSLNDINTNNNNNNTNKTSFTMPKMIPLNNNFNTTTTRTTQLDTNGKEGGGITMNGFMDSVEEFIKNEERLQQNNSNNNNNNTNQFQQTIENQSQYVSRLNEQEQGQEQFDDQFICGVYICPSPAPKILSTTLNILSQPSHEQYQYAVQEYLHSTLKTIPYSFLKFYFELTMQCPNPLFTILDPLLLNINTEAYHQYNLSILQQQEYNKQQLFIKKNGPNSIKKSNLIQPLDNDTKILIQSPFVPPLPSLLTYLLHDEVLLSVGSEDIITSDKSIAQLLFLDMVTPLSNSDTVIDINNGNNNNNNIIINTEEKPNYPTTFNINSIDWNNIMMEIKKQSYFNLIDWQETVND